MEWSFLAARVAGAAARPATFAATGSYAIALGVLGRALPLAGAVAGALTGAAAGALAGPGELRGGALCDDLGRLCVDLARALAGGLGGDVDVALGRIVARLDLDPAGEDRLDGRNLGILAGDDRDVVVAFFQHTPKRGRDRHPALRIHLVGAFASETSCHEWRSFFPRQPPFWGLEMVTEDQAAATA